MEVFPMRHENISSLLLILWCLIRDVFMPQLPSPCEHLKGSPSFSTLPYFLYSDGHMISLKPVCFVKGRVLNTATGP